MHEHTCLFFSKAICSGKRSSLFKVKFFGGDRAGDLGGMKTKEILYFPEKKTLLFNHTLT